MLSQVNQIKHCYTIHTVAIVIIVQIFSSKYSCCYELTRICLGIKKSWHDTLFDFFLQRKFFFFGKVEMSIYRNTVTCLDFLLFNLFQFFFKRSVSVLYIVKSNLDSYAMKWIQYVGLTTATLLSRHGVVTRISTSYRRCMS